MPPNAPITPNGLCPHKQNPKACLTCFHIQGSKRPATQIPHGALSATNPHALSAPPGSTSDEALWQPPVHQSVSDRQPRRW
jgi:hypothetical protein